MINLKVGSYELKNIASLINDYTRGDGKGEVFDCKTSGHTLVSTKKKENRF